MVVTESQVNNIMGGMENTAGVRLHSHRHKLKQRFDILRKLGQGTYGKVQLAVNKETSQEVAIKTIKKAKIETEQDLIRIRREIQIMSSVQHPQIIHIYEVFENREKMVLVMEYAAGGELYDYLSDRKVLNEEEARRVFRQVASAVYYCHKHKICHRDLKLENILLDLEGNAKIADFGLSNVFGDKRRLDTFCGSPLYASPEIVKGIPYVGPEVDCWSLGVLLYTLVYGAMPFDGSNFKRLVKQITMGDYYEPKKPSRASDLIRHMLTVSAAKRASIEDICSHWWVNEGYMESCLEVAEFLANQTPVRLDLLLSLVPKHINSEHMLIQPDEDDSSHQSQVNADSQGPPQLELPPPPPLPSDNELVPDVPARSHSMGAMANIDQSEFEALLELKRQEKREKEEDEKKRKREGSSTAERKKKKDATSEGTPKPRRKESSTTKAEDSSQAATMDTDVSECSEATPSVRRKGSKKPPTVPAGSDSIERKKSTRRKDSMNEGRDHSEKSERRKSIKKREPSMEVDVNDVSERSERRKSLKKKEPSVDRDMSESEKSERRKSIKKRDTSTSRESSANAEKTEKKRNLKQKEKDSEVEKAESLTQNDTSVEPSSVISVDKPVNKPDSLENYKEVSESLHEAQVIAPAAVAAPLPTPTTEMVRKPPLPREVQEKIRLSTEDSRPPPKDEAVRLGKPSEQDAPTKSKGESEGKKVVDKSSSGKSLISLTSNEGTLKASDSSISRGGSVSPVKTAGEDSGISSLSSHVKKEKSKSRSPVPKISIEIPKGSGIHETSSPEATGVLGSPQSPLLPPDTEKILQETASKIKETEGYATPGKAKSPEIKSGDVKSESTSSKDSSRQSSLTSTPVRSRTGSESSTDAPGRRQSKIFSKAAMWDNMISQGTKEKTPTGDKPKKIGRPGGPNMADLAKKFEDKSTPERKSVILPAFKISDARKAFESKPAEKPNFPRKKSIDSTPSSPTAKEVPKLDHTSSGKLKDKVKESTPLSNGSSKDLKIVSRKNSLKEKSPIKDVKDKLPKKEGPKEKTPTRNSSSKIESEEKTKKEEKSELPNQVPKAAVDDKMVKPKTQTKTLEVKEREIITSSEEDEAVVVGGLNLKLGGVGKIAEVGTKQELKRTDSSDSSDSESEAEKLLKLLAEKREKVEAAKREKLRKVSQMGVEKDMPAISEESKSPSVSPSKSPEKTRKVIPLEPKESPEQKYATLPKGFKTKSKLSNGEARGIGSGSSTEKMERDALISQEIEGMMSAIKAVDRALTQEEQEIQLLKDSLVKTLPDGGKAPSVTSSQAGSKEKLYSPRADRRTPGKEVQVIPPSQVLSPTPRDKEDPGQRQWGSARKEPPSSGMQQVRIEYAPGVTRLATLVVAEPSRTITTTAPATTVSTPTVMSKATPIASVSSDHVHKTRVTQIPGEEVEKQKDADGTTPTRKKAQMEIILNNRPDETKKRSSYAEIQLTSPTAKEQPKHEYKTEKDHPPRSSKPLGEPQLRRARRERIIPIVLEDDDDDDRSLSESQPPPNTPSSARQMISPERGGMGSSSSSLGGGGVRGLSSPLSSMSSTSHTKASIPSEPSSQHTSRTVSPEPIKKSRRERIIPISVEGEGIVTPPSSVAASLGEVGADLGAARAHEAFQRNLGTSGRNKTFRTRGFSMLDRSESFSSAGEDEEDEDDGFQILTAESLFSTLLNRVRNLTRKMNADDRPERKRSSHQATPEPAMSPPPHSAGAASGFWSSLYSSPRDSPARRISETLSRSFSREDDGVGGMTSPAWSHRSVSRDPSDADTVFSESSTPFSTLPRGWRSRISGGEDGAESDTSEASSRSLPRRAPPYSRAPSRDLHNIPDDPAEEDAARTNSSMTYPRPYMGSSSASAEDHRQTTAAGGFISRPLRPADQERIAMYGTLRGRGERRPHSAMVSDSYREAPDASGLRRGGPSGEASGRDGGHFEQQQVNAAPNNITQQRNQTRASSGSSQLKQGVDASVATNVPSREQMSSPENFQQSTNVPAVHLKEASPVQPEAQSPRPSVQDQIRQLVKELEETPYDEGQSQVNKESSSGPTATTVSPPRSTVSSPVFRSSSVTSGSNVVKKSIGKDPRLTNSSTSISVTLAKPQVPIIHKPTGLQGGLAKNSAPLRTSRSSTSASKDSLPKKKSMPGLHFKEYTKGTSSSEAEKKKFEAKANQVCAVAAEKNSDLISKHQAHVTKSESSLDAKMIKEISSSKISTKEFSPTFSSAQEPQTESLNEKSNVETKAEITFSVVDHPSNKTRSSHNALDVVKFDDASSVASSTDTSLSRESRTSSALTDATTVSRDSRGSSVAITEPTSTTDSVCRASTTTEVAFRAGSVVRSADSSALDAYRRSKSRGELVTRSAYSTLEKPTGPEPYRRGKSEDLRHAIDTVNRLETPLQRYRKSRSRDLERSVEAASQISTDLLSPTQPYQRSKSRELTPAIEAAGEKFNQLNSGTLKRISPFEAYRRSRSRELGPAIDMVTNRELEKIRSPPSTLERAKSPFERAKTSIERKFDRAMSPMRSKSPLMERSKTMEHTKSPLAAKDCKANGDLESSTLPPKSPQASGDRKLFTSVEPENDLEESEKKKKTSAGELEKPKSMYKLITSKFSKSQSSLPDVSKVKKNEEDEGVEKDDKDDKFILKRPSRFLKQKTEKSQSRTSINSTIEEPTRCEDKVEDSDRGDRKPSKKITHALNKFLGRKDSKGEDGKSDSTHQLNSSTSSVPSVDVTGTTDEEKTKKVPRFKIKRFSKSQENLNQQVKEEEDKMLPVERSMSEAPQVRVVSKNPDPNVKSIMKKKSGDGPAPHSPEITIESVTKSLCDHLTQLESDITNRIGNIPTQSSASTTELSKPTTNMATHSKSSGSISAQISTYGLSPALASRRGGRPSNLGLSSSGIDNVKNLEDKIARESKENTADVNAETGDSVKYAKVKRLDTIEDAEEGRHTPTESGESVSSEGLDDRGNASATEDESVMDRITRKSFYSRFQDPKKQKARRINTKESIDQQLAMAKARLMKEDEEFARSASHEPSRVTSPVSPRSSQTSMYESSIPRRSSRKSSGPRTSSMPPEDLLSIGKPSPRSSSVQPEELKNRRMPSLPPEDRHRHTSSVRSPSMPRDIGYPSPFRSPSVPPEDLKYRERRILSVAEEPDDQADEISAPSQAVAAAVAAGKAAGLAAAAEEKESKQGKSRETSLARVTSPEPQTGRQSHSIRASSQDPIHTAREELSRRLTPLTRIGNQNSRASDGLGQRSYRRTVTTGRLGDLTPSVTPAVPTKTVPERPAYRRTNTMDLPPSDARGRSGSEYRRFIQDPVRRYSAARTPGTDNINNTSSCSTNDSYSHRDLTASNPSTSPSSTHSPTSTLLRSRLSSLYDQSPSPTSPTSRLTSSAFSYSSPTSLSRRMSFYRY